MIHRKGGTGWTPVFTGMTGKGIDRIHAAMLESHKASAA